MRSRTLMRVTSTAKVLRPISHRAPINASSNPRLSASSSPSAPSHPFFAPTQSFHTTATMKGRFALPKKGDPTPAPKYLNDRPPPYCQTCGRVMKIEWTQEKPAVLPLPERKYCCGGCQRRRPKRVDFEIEEAFVNFLNDTNGSGQRKLVSVDDVETFFFGRIEDMPEDERPRRDHREKQREQVRRAARRGVAFGFTKYNGLARWPKCEVVQNGKVVEPSFAKGDFYVRWRE